MAWTRRRREIGIASNDSFRRTPHLPHRECRPFLDQPSRSTFSFSNSIHLARSLRQSDKALNAANDGQTIGRSAGNEMKTVDCAWRTWRKCFGHRRFYFDAKGKPKTKKKLTRLHRASSSTINRSSKLCPSVFESPIPVGNFSYFARSLAW